MSRFWPQGLPLQVQVDAWQTPIRFVWNGCAHPVDEVVCRWRVDEGWWTGHRQWREYFRLATTTGLLVELYHDLLGGGWRLQRLYD